MILTLYRMIKDLSIFPNSEMQWLLKNISIFL